MFASIFLTATVFGADDAAELQAALNRGGAVTLAARTYRLERTLVVDLARTGFVGVHGAGVARLEMHVPGPAILVRGTHTGTADPKTVRPDVWAKERSPTLDGFEIVGAHPQADGLAADGTMQLTLSRLVVRRCRHAVHLVNRNRNIVLSACHLYENRGVGVFYDRVNLHQSNIVGCHISYNGQGGVVVRGGDVRNLHLSGCDIEGNQDPAGPPTANVLFDCTGGQMGEVAISGCTVQHGRQAPGSANVRMLGRSTLARERTPERREGHVAIVGNVFSDVHVNVELKQVRGATLAGNSFWQSFAHNLLVEDSSQINLAGNNFDRNPRYDDRDAAAERTGVAFRRCDGCTLAGVKIVELRAPIGEKRPALWLDRCERVNVTAASVLDCDGVGILLENCKRCRVGESVVRDDRPQGGAESIVCRGGAGNFITGNLLSKEPLLEPGAAKSLNNVVE
jgi:hypothetical protein